MLTLLGAGGFVLSPLPAFAQTRGGEPERDFGLLVMAHGGGPNWNREVEAMLAPLRGDYLVEIAFGMAEAVSLQEGVRKLEAQGVRRIGVVRLFISGESWYERTEQILGLRPGASPRPVAEAHGGPNGHTGHDMAAWRINTNAAFALTTQGLAEAPEIGAVLAERARALSGDVRQESVLIIAHGPTDDAENQRWLAHIDARAAVVRQSAPFKRVQVETLREDWPEKRSASEARIRAFVDEASRDGGRVIVTPFRVAGFGPYARVLEGLPYASDGRALLPSAEVERWVRGQAQELRAGTFRHPARAPEPE